MYEDRESVDAPADNSEHLAMERVRELVQRCQTLEKQLAEQRALHRNFVENVASAASGDDIAQKAAYR